MSMPERIYASRTDGGYNDWWVNRPPVGPYEAGYVRDDIVAEKDAEIARLKAENLELFVKANDLELLQYSDQQEVERLRKALEQAIDYGGADVTDILNRPDDARHHQELVAYLRERNAKETT